MKIGVFFILTLCLLGVASGAYSQPAPYLTAATFYLSVDDWADISLNNIPIIDSQPRTDANKGPKTRACLPKHLCYFQTENILSIEIDDSRNPSDPQNNFVGVAYVLQLDFSDGTRQVISSREVGQHSAFYVPDYMMGNPPGWQRFHYDDSGWAKAKSTGTSIPGLAELNGPRYGGDTDFLSASSLSSKALHPGERHLFRRKFFLNISPNPNCDTPTKSPRIEPLVVTQPDLRHSVVLPTPTSTPTALSLPPWSYTPTWTAIPTQVYQQPAVKVKTFEEVWRTLTPTPTIVFIQPTLAVPAVERAPVMPEKVILLMPTPTFTVIPAPSEGQTIVFDSSPANIYMSFADGPGVYRLEIFDKSGRHLRSLFEKKVVAQEDAWAEWDGKNDEGQDVPPGQYDVVYSKGGRELKRMILLRSGTNKNP